MDLHRSGWLQEALASILAGYDPELGTERLAPALCAAGPRTRVRLHVEAELRRSGLVYGFPKLPSRVGGGRRLSKDEAHFLGVLANKSFLALDIARLLEIPYDRMRAEADLTLLLASTAGRHDLVEAGLALTHPEELEEALPHLQSKLESSLRDRIPPVVGDILFDLPLHNGVAFGEARVMGTLAWHHYLTPHAVSATWERRAARLLTAMQREQVLLTEALVASASERGRWTEPHRRLMRRTLRQAKLPRQVERRLREALADPPELLDSTARIQSRSLRRFVLEQLVLTSALAGDRGSSGSIQRIACDFDMEDDVARIEAEVAEQVYGSEDVFDAFEGRVAAQRSSGKWVDRIVEEIVINLGRVNQEVRETGELTQLLAKAAMGQGLTAEEKEKVREQLIDLAKVVPSLAILAAPGGTLILAALLKVLPFSLLPSSFQNREELPPPVERRRKRAPGKARRGSSTP
jgi:hypothetical protein